MATNIFYERMIASGAYVACGQCAKPVPAARAACPISHGLCEDCNAPTLAHSRDVKEIQPNFTRSNASDGFEVRAL